MRSFGLRKNGRRFIRFGDPSDIETEVTLSRRHLATRVNMGYESGVAGGVRGLGAALIISLHTAPPMG